MIEINMNMGLMNIEYDPVNLNCKGTFTGHTGPVWGLAVTEDGFLVSASSDTTIKVFYMIIINIDPLHSDMGRCQHEMQANIAWTRRNSACSRCAWYIQKIIE
jgi:WD40 repeat protein